MAGRDGRRSAEGAHALELEISNVKLSVMQENLARGLSVVSRAVSTRSTLPVLANVLLKTEDGGLKLTATNLEIGITHWVPGKIDTDGATTVPAKLLTDYVNALQGGERVDLELTPGETLHLRAGRYESHLKGIDADEFPAIQTAGERPTTRISQKVLRQALEETAFAAASDEARPILTGVLARFEGDTLTLAAADNYRIAVKTIPILDAVPETSVVIPARALNELARILADVDEPVDVVLAQAKNQVLFHLEGIDLISRLIDGQFPNYNQVLPTSHTTRAVLDREELLRAVRPAALIAHESANIVKLQISSNGDAGVTVSANAEIGDHVGQVEAAVEGDGTTIAFNARYLADVLTNVGAEQFALELNGPLSPGVFKPVGDDRYVHVVMPVRTTS
jgi:DNA polymerase-3 subunit beta